jgi:hypothetical protein
MRFTRGKETPGKMPSNAVVVNTVYALSNSDSNFNAVDAIMSTMNTNARISDASPQTTRFEPRH